ncbi:T9SS type A sorting domain-containing protein [Candidatus Margulisiibacteriota bacterium]
MFRIWAFGLVVCMVVGIWSLEVNAFTGQSAGISYKSSPETVISGGTSSWTAFGLNAIGTASNSAYSTQLGFFASSASYTTAEVGSPTITSLLFDGAAIQSGDYVNNDVAITANITDPDGVDTATSSVEVDGTITAFSALSGNSSYTAASGILTYQPASNFTNGAHTFRIYARDTGGNFSATTISFNVASSDGIVGAVLNYPNPFNPNNGPTEIGYQLNRDTNIMIYIFNTLGQMVWKRNYPAGTSGGRAGYNTINWNGYSDFGHLCPNDIYLLRIVADGKVIGKCKIAVLK